MRLGNFLDRTLKVTTINKKDKLGFIKNFFSSEDFI